MTDHVHAMYMAYAHLLTKCNPSGAYHDVICTNPKGQVPTYISVQPTSCSETKGLPQEEIPAAIK